MALPPPISSRAPGRKAAAAVAVTVAACTTAIMARWAVARGCCGARGALRHRRRFLARLRQQGGQAFARQALQRAEVAFAEPRGLEIAQQARTLLLLRIHRRHRLRRHVAARRTVLPRAMVMAWCAALGLAVFTSRWTVRLLRTVTARWAIALGPVAARTIALRPLTVRTISLGAIALGPVATRALTLRTFTLRTITPRAVALWPIASGTLTLRTLTLRTVPLRTITARRALLPGLAVRPRRTRRSIGTRRAVGLGRPVAGCSAFRLRHRGVGRLLLAVLLSIL